MFSIFVSSFAPSSFPTEDLESRVGISRTPSQSASGRTATCVSVHVCSSALVLPLLAGPLGLVVPLVAQHSGRIGLQWKIPQITSALYCLLLLRSVRSLSSQVFQRLVWTECSVESLWSRWCAGGGGGGGKSEL